MTTRPKHRPKCPYCGQWSVQITGAELYPHLPKLAAKKFYRCAPCDAYVGCHGQSDQPLGTLANKSLRMARNRAHAAFDPMWQGRGKAKRSAGYRWLAEQMDMPVKDCHIAMMSIEQCRRVVEICAPYRRERSR